MIDKVDLDYDPEVIEGRVREFWEENDVYERSRKRDLDVEERFYFVDGPPYTTGRIHLGTTWNKIIKDAVLRYTTLKGVPVMDRAGWDMHGLPIEVKVEKEFDFESKQDIEDFGIDNFVKECKNYALQYKESMTEQFKELGAWLDWDDPYMTINNNYIESAWWTLKRADERGLLEKGKRIVNWCPRCETALADSEVEYDEVSDPSIFVKFPVEGYENRFIVIWTTTPWTIPSNLAVAVHPDYEYSVVKAVRDGETEELIVSSELIEDVLREGRYEDYEVVETYIGRELEGLEYRFPLSEQVPKQQEHISDLVHTVFAEEFVTVEKTGLVHSAPSHGHEDFDMGQKRGLPLFNIVDEKGQYTDGGGKYSGLYVKDADPVIIDDLQQNGLLLSSEEIKHRYGHCWRCDTSIIYLATSQWFLNVSELKDKMVSEVDRVEWTPEWAGSSRFKDWVSNAKDWCISRQRYWGIPLPVWECSCGSRTTIGTIDELKEKAFNCPEDGLELHRPHVDKILLECDDCGSDMERVEDVIDVWFDSGVASWANLKYPEEEDLFEEWWPADFIVEGHDQTRGWFYSQLGAGVIAFDRAPYESVLMHGFVLDEDGKKMSKSVGNVVQPEEIIERYGTDTLRLYLLSECAPWEDLKFNWDECQNVKRTLNVFWNVYKFTSTYMSLDDFKPQKKLDEKALKTEDRWILSRLNNLILDVEEAIESRQIHKGARYIKSFILEDLSRWYIRLIRDRTWVEAEDKDKLTAYETLHEVIHKTLILMSPYTPFITDKMYQNLVKTQDFGKESVHLEKFPKPKKEFINNELEQQMEIAREIIESASHARQKVELNLRWPVQKITIEPNNPETVKAIETMDRIIKDQVNTKKIETLEPNTEFPELQTVIEPDMGVIGPKFKDKAEKVMNTIKQGNHKPKNLPKTIKVDGEEIKITREMVNLETKVPEKYSTSSFTNGVVYVDSELTTKLKQEGYAKETIRRIQEMRKELDLHVEDYIEINLDTPDKEFKKSITKWSEHISHETRAKKLEINTPHGDLTKQWEINGKELEIGLTPKNK
ncbi:isoleucine--tRNA ligase [Methanonatronarchaeum sp. AMET-Sl]|uniref:isoleucine--tRNA ligase n=1 Tax=Methanonatronarchaeum sp. AMET-Sl TaxID=3037654 RepID=UPI00244E1E28|nr:isoleucine--tRNA ligase [Methanonatronarchaeum sp. AMET-Sl]WGI17430.1 isoleucine--tRNA ligase [Methanonatronarchaeum sp. AMET-Sl]